MKKTLITLAALAMASVAGAAETWHSGTLDQVKGDAQAADSAADGSYTLLLTLNWDTLDDFGANSYDNRQSIVEVRGNGVTNGLYMWLDSNGDIYAKIAVDNQQASNLTTVENATWGNDQHSYKLTKSLYGIDASEGMGEERIKFAVALTFNPNAVLDEEGNTIVPANAVTFHALYKDGTTIGSAYTVDTDIADTFAGFTSVFFNAENGIVSSAYMYNEVLDSASLAKIAYQVVPEPATATLSLLALAGLAARRRRK